jgi:chemotaxis protein histidine kinase CheA
MLYDVTVMAIDDLSEYKELFDTTAHEYLEALKKSLTELAQNPAATEAIATAYISTHSLKSQCLAMGFTQTGLLCKVLEYNFSQIKDKEKQLTPVLQKKLEQAANELENSLTTIRTTNIEIDLQQAIEHLS